MNAQIRCRLKWVKLYEELGDAGVVCRRCGISRPTLRKWVKRYQQEGEVGLDSMSRRPHHSPNRKVTQTDQDNILRMRGENKGARRIQNELRLYEQKELSLRTIHKVLVAAKVNPLVKPKRSIPSKRYSLLIPGERVQIDTMKVAPGVYQYTAVDDCSRFRVLAVHPRRDARHTLLFLDRVIEEMPFPIQRIQTDRGTEFFAESVQRYLMSNCIKFRPIPPRSPHLNGKVERSQLTDKIEFWSRYSHKEQGIDQRIEEWQFEYNWRRPHGSLSGKTPVGKLAEVGAQIPLSEDITSAYDLRKERIRYSNWKVDLAIAAMDLQ
ncbi:IS481 family transposase [Mycoavidus sp. HKI]|uniref:IS481 family transposase n=1 Tax=Mycoavidus sp. HKI TaxID=2840467 RepID=UPI001CBDA219|nr:IS481 family transposase [Mycoavidus sp. HKI]UAW63593.1 IS481 family transposase [Mycoavidus sp. HKI]